jgi:hypothetical protein
MTPLKVYSFEGELFGGELFGGELFDGELFDGELLPIARLRVGAYRRWALSS